MKCLDTYALVEIANANPKFAHLLTEKTVITDVTLAEFYGCLYKKYSPFAADYWHKKLSFLCKPVPRELLIQAVKMRIEHAKENLSFFDCVGYVFAQEHGLIFVTGDKAFEKREGVEYIKA